MHYNQIKQASGKLNRRPILFKRCYILCYFVSEELQLQYPPRAAAHEPLSGQPMHLTPLFFFFIIYATASPTITVSMPAIIQSAKFITTTPYFTFIVGFLLLLKAYSDFILLFVFTITATITPIITRSAISPGTNPAPSVPAVASIPI